MQKIPVCFFEKRDKSGRGLRVRQKRSRDKQRRKGKYDCSDFADYGDKEKPFGQIFSKDFQILPFDFKGIR